MVTLLNTIVSISIIAFVITYFINLFLHAVPDGSKYGTFININKKHIVKWKIVNITLIFIALISSLVLKYWF